MATSNTTFNLQDFWKSETHLDPIPPTPLVFLATILMAIILFLVGGLVVINRLPQNSTQPAVDRGGSQPAFQSTE